MKKEPWILHLKAHSLRQFVATESPLKMMMNNALYLALKAFFVLKTFKL